MRTKTVLQLSVVCLLGFLALSAIAGVFMAEGTLHPGRRPLAAKDEMQVREMVLRHQSELVDVAIVASDRVSLRAWSIRPHNESRGAVILLHGLSDNRLGMIGYAELL